MNFILHFCGILLGKIVTNHIHTRIITDNSCIYAVISIFQRSLVVRFAHVGGNEVALVAKAFMVSLRSREVAKAFGFLFKSRCS